MKKFLIMSFAALASVFQSCENNDDLWNAIDDLNGRVQALETQVKALNDNIAALQQLYGGATIKDVVKNGDDWVITLSNGEQITLAQGSVADAVIPIMGITDDGYWQYSTDNGSTWTRLDVKAAASDGKTPQFRVDEATGYWQVSYGDAQWTNVTDSSGQPVKAVGEGTVTDRFFADVKVEDGMFCITLKDPAATQLRIPILSDFFCRITLDTPGVQTFAAGETKTFSVEIRGVGGDDMSVMAPDGWAAHLTEPVSETAQLIVTAPAATPSGTRATADNTKDVSILCIVGGYASITKMQVELGADVPAPTVAVANSATTAPTSSSLTFDVTPANADGWKYLCLKSSEPAPDADRIMADGTTGTGTSVTVEGLEAATEYALYVVAYAGEVKSEVQSARNTTAEAPVTVADYYQDYLDGKDVVIGKTTINKTTHPDAQLRTSADGNFTNAILQAGGVFFIDNTESAAYSVEGTSVNAGRNADLVIIGRYPARAQAVLTLPETRCNGNVRIRNMRLVATNATTMFNSTNAHLHTGGALDPDLELVDCTIDLTASRYLIYDNNTSGSSFGNISIANSIVQYATSNNPALYAMTSTAKPAYTTKCIEVTNSVIYAQTATQAFLINCGDGNTKYATDDLQIMVTGNTFYNLYQQNIMIRGYKMAGLTVTHNVGYFAGVTFRSYLVGVYDTASPTTEGTVSYNYLYAENPGANCFWSAKYGSTGNYTPANNRISNATTLDLAIPFATQDVSRGYFPVDASIVTIGGEIPGATYDTKMWFEAR